MTGAVGSEVNVEVDVRSDLRVLFCTTPSAGSGDKASLPTAGLQWLGVVLLCGLFLPDTFPHCAAARWKLCFRHVQCFVDI